jgi:hypothetical protein
MTLTTTSVKAVAQGNGATTVWPYTFLVPAETDLVVTLVEISSGNPTVLAPSVYTVTGIGDPVGGAVTYPLSGSPLAMTFDIVVERLVPDVQETDLTNQGGVYPQDIEDALDYLTMITQQQQDQINRSIVFSIADTIGTSTLPVASARAGLLLGFDSNGNPIAVDTIAGGTIVSAAMIPVVTAPTTADALVALGLPGSLLALLIPSGTIWDYSTGDVPSGFVFPIGQACTPIYPDFRAKLVAAGSPYGTNGTDPLMPDLRSAVIAGKSNMGGADNGLLPGGTVLGALLGSATRVLVTTNLPPQPAPSGTIVSTSSTILLDTESLTVSAGPTPIIVNSGAGTPDNRTPTITSTFTGIALTGQNSTAFSIVQPTLICNKIIKVH